MVLNQTIQNSFTLEIAKPFAHPSTTNIKFSYIMVFSFSICF